MGKIVIHGLIFSPPVRAVLLTCKALNLEYDLKHVDLLSAEHKSEEFQKKNPQHTVPVLEDNGEFIWDSHAISAYLVSKYGKEDSLYPKDLLKRAIVDQRLHFDSGVLFPSLRAITGPLFFENDVNFPAEKITAIKSGFDFVEKFLGTNLYLTGNTVTIADFCCVASVTSLEALVPLDPENYPSITAWIKRLSQLSYYESGNGEGARGLVELVHGQIAKLKGSN